MGHRIAADLVVTFHLLFVLFVVLGGLLVLRWRRLLWVHVPCAIWGALIELTPLTCPLTRYEKSLRQAAGEAGYEGGFINHYIMPVLYPAGLTRGWSIVLGIAVVLVNLAIYSRLVAERRGEPPRGAPHAGRS